MWLRGAMQPWATMSAAAEIPSDIDPDWSFAQLPIGRVVHLDSAPFEVVAAALDPLPDDAPAVLSCHLGAARTPAEVVGVILDELEAAAMQLFPAWLPGGGDLDGRRGADVRAVRADHGVHAEHPGSCVTGA